MGVCERYYSWILVGFRFFNLFFLDFDRFSYVKGIFLGFW